MSISLKCACGRKLLAKDEHAGRSANCPSCGAVVEIPLSIELESFDDIPSRSEDESASHRRILPVPLPTHPQGESAQTFSGNAPGERFALAEGSNGQTREYKVLTQKDKWFSGKFDPARLEEALNSYAEQGWVVRAVTTASIPGFGGNREELIVVLER